MEEKVQVRVQMNFGEALELLKKGEKVCREGWNGKGMFLHLAYANSGGKLSEAIGYNTKFEGVDTYLQNFIVMKTADNKLVPWLASQTDILAEDWCEL